MDNETLTRMLIELLELHERTSKLLNFIESNERFTILPQKCKDDLEEQLSHMGDYAEVLARRISWAFGNVSL